MPVWIVTGKLGNGKTLVSVSRIREYLFRGRMVATNLDLNMTPLVRSKTAKNVRVIRLPDKPKSSNLNGLPFANHSTDESLNGLMVLDECGTWLNARTFGDKDRAKFIDWLVHARKRGWDIILIIQDIRQIDKQVRESLAEFVVYCRRLDRTSMPIITPIFKFLGMAIRPPRIHVGLVTYGAERNSPVSDRWIYQGSDLFEAYDTKQIFDERNDVMYSYLPPFYLKRTPKCEKNLRNIMKITKIVLRKYSRLTIALVASLISGLVVAGYMKIEMSQVNEKITYLESQLGTIKVSDTEILLPESMTELKEKQTRSIFDGLYISGSIVYGDEIKYILTNDYGTLTSKDLENRGYKIKIRNRCEFVFSRKFNSVDTGIVYCGETNNGEGI